MDDSAYTDDYRNGTVALYEGRLPDALMFFDRVPDDSPCHSMALGNAALALFRMDRYQEAEARGRQALFDIRHRGCLYPPAQVQFIRNLGEAIGRQGRWAESIQTFGWACQLADTLVRDYEALTAEIQCQKAHTLNSLANAWIHLGQFAKAVESLEQARYLLRRHSGSNRTGHAEVLTNLALALGAMGEMTRAGFAIKEAMNIVQETEDYDQLFRNLLAAAQLGSELIPTNRVLPLIEAGIEDAVAGKRFGIAYLRSCIGISLIQSQEDLEVGRRLARGARQIENHIDQQDPNIAMLRSLEASLMERTGEPSSRITTVLIEGAFHWYRRIAGPLVPADFENMSSDLHMHFRYLAGRLLEEGRVEEAIVSFDTGRALGYAVEVDPQFVSRVIGRNPFAADGTRIDLALLRQAQQMLGPHEVAIVLAVIPPRMIALLVGRDGVGSVARVVASTQKDLDELDGEVKVLPRRLAEGIGHRAVPRVLLDFAQEVVSAIGDRAVSTFIPYNSLHLVPWRAVLRQCGLPWRNLAFPIAFNFLMRQGLQIRNTARLRDAVGYFRFHERLAELLDGKLLLFAAFHQFDDFFLCGLLAQLLALPTEGSRDFLNMARLTMGKLGYPNFGLGIACFELLSGV